MVCIDIYVIASIYIAGVRFGVSKFIPFKLVIVSYVKYILLFDEQNMFVIGTFLNVGAFIGFFSL